MAWHWNFGGLARYWNWEAFQRKRFRQETREKKDKAKERILPVLSFCGIKGGWKWRLHFVEKHPNFMEKRVAADKRCEGKFYKMGLLADGFCETRLYKSVLLQSGFA